MNLEAFSRRAFLTGLAATAAAGWVYDSDTFTARTCRGALKDFSRPLEVPPAPDLSAWSADSVDACWIGHGTVLLNFHGVKILTDPVLFDRIGVATPFGTIGRRRVVAAALGPDQLQDVDVVLISHAHMDHLDEASLQALPKKAQVITAGRTADLVRSSGFKQVRELRWGEKARVLAHNEELEISAFEVKHWGARFGNDTYRGYNGYLLSREGKSIVFGGDTAFTDRFRAIGCSKVAAAIMPIGSYGRGGPHHCTPEEAVKMAGHCKAEFIIPVHHATFPIGKEPFAEPLERLENALSADRIALRKVGQLWTLPG